MNQPNGAAQPIGLEQQLQAILYSFTEQDLVLIAKDPSAKVSWGIREIPTIDYVLAQRNISKVRIARELETLCGVFDYAGYRKALLQPGGGKTPEVRKILSLAMQDLLEISSVQGVQEVYSRDVLILLQLSRTEGPVGELLNKHGLDEQAILEEIHRHIREVERKAD